MKKNNKGVSLVSLIIVIIVTIILISIVVAVGYDYIQESNKTKTTAVVKFISDAASQRQNDKHINATAYYIGHPFTGSNIDKIKGLPDDFEMKSEGMWYLIDAKSAEKLGVLDSHKYIEEDLKNPKADTVKTVLVDYVTGEAYLIEIDKTLLGGSIAESICNESAGGTHMYSIQNCIKGSVCINCGAPNPGHDEALGHDYSEPTCTAAATCTRCIEIDVTRPAKGHTFKTDASGEEDWITDATRHWKECIICGTKKETEAHEKGYVRIELSASNYDPEYHKEVCAVCGWQSVKTEHKIKYEVSGEFTHRRFCELCEYSEEHRDSGWIIGDEIYHWRECEDDCPFPDDNKISHVDGEKIFNGMHQDNNGDGVCDTCLKVLDKQPPNSFNSPSSYAKLDEATTSALKVSAYTQDNLGIQGYKFAIDEDGDGVIDWSLVEMIPVEEDVPGVTTFYNLQDNTEYAIYVVAVDTGNNLTPQYRIPNTNTAKLPKVEIVGIPTSYVSNDFTVMFETNTTLPNISTEYSVDGGTTWIEGDSVVINKETVNLSVRAKDTRQPEANKGEATTNVITNFDKTAPEVEIAAKSGDEPNEVKTTHTAIVTITDDKSKIATGTTIKYAWSLSNTTPPTTYTQVTTSNTGVQTSVSTEIQTPTGVSGKYYLWIEKGVSDSLGNKTTENVCSTFAFNVDDEEVLLSNIKMYNPNPEVANQNGFVKTNGTVRVTFAANKALAKAPTVVVGGVTVTNVTSTDKLNWTASILATTAMSEGALTLKISGLEATSGKTSNKEYTNADLTGASVVYDKTLPGLEYIEK